MLHLRLPATKALGGWFWGGRRAALRDRGLSFPASRSSTQVHVLIMEYPGYGICPGKPSEELLMGVAVHVCRIVLRRQESFHKASQTCLSFVTEATHWETGASFQAFQPGVVLCRLLGV